AKAARSRSAWSRILRIRVHGETLTYPDLLLEGAYAVAIGGIAGTVTGSEAITEALADSSGPKAVPGVRLRFLDLACTEILKEQPQRLLGPDRAAASLECLELPASVRDALGKRLDLWVGSLRAVLSLRISLADHAVVSSVLAQGGLPDAPLGTIAECLIATL